jgi:hypothetical protein
MIKELNQIENSILKSIGLKISEVNTDNECADYHGLNFQIHNLNIKFRKAKVTPKKTGQFVTLWKRNAIGKTEPFNSTDNFDFYIIATEQGNKFGFFLFSKQILVEKRILTGNDIKGKLGFRVYSSWHIPDNKQAEKTKEWQSRYFIDFANENNIENFKTIINSY